MLPLGLTAPRSVTPGAPFDVSVVEYAADGTPSPVAGATVSGGDAPATTNAAGNATVTVSAGGPFSLRATKDNRAPSATEAACATTGADGAVRDGAAGGGRRGGDGVRRASGSDGRCGTSRHARRRRRRSRPSARASASPARKGPRRITATIASDPSGLQVVKLRLTRTDGPRCTYYSGKSERFRRAPCGVNRAPWFAVGDREQVDYLLPQKLGRGRYVLDVNAVDKARNRDDARRRGANRVVFHVR